MYKRQQQHRHSVVLRTQRPDHLKAGAFRQHHIEHHHVVLSAHRVVKPVTTVVNSVDTVFLFTHDLAERVCQPSFILHNQYPHLLPSFPSVCFYDARSKTQ